MSGPASRGAMEPERRLSRFATGYLLLQVRGLDEDELWLGDGALNPPGWCLGHVAVEADRALVALGRPRRTPQGWDALFLAGTSPTVPPAERPLGDALRRAVIDVYADLNAVTAGLDEATLGGSSPIGALAPHLPTLRDWLGHVLTTHAAMHGGNVAAWRRVHGRPPVTGL